MIEKKHVPRRHVAGMEDLAGLLDRLVTIWLYVKDLKQMDKLVILLSSVHLH